MSVLLYLSESKIFDILTTFTKLVILPHSLLERPANVAAGQNTAIFNPNQ